MLCSFWEDIIYSIIACVNHFNRGVLLGRRSNVTSFEFGSVLLIVSESAASFLPFLMTVVLLFAGWHISHILFTTLPKIYWACPGNRPFSFVIWMENGLLDVQASVILLVIFTCIMSDSRFVWGVKGESFIWYEWLLYYIKQFISFASMSWALSLCAIAYALVCIERDSYVCMICNFGQSRREEAWT